MQLRQLGKTALMVSPICLGAGQFGTGLPRESAFWQLDAFTDRGGNFIDTAHVYGDWEPGETARSERIIGQWLRSSGKRDQVVITTKGGHPRLETMDKSRCTPQDIETDINESLQCLGVEYIDLYLLHRDNPRISVGELLETLEKARKQGKIGHYGFSNWPLPRAREAEDYARQAGIEGFSCNQIMWSLAEISAESITDRTLVMMDRDTYDWHSAGDLGVTAYHSTAHGWFSKLERGIDPPEKLKVRYDNERNGKIYALLRRAAGELGLPALAITLGYMTAHPFPSAPITSFSANEQLEEALEVCETALPRELAAEFNALKGLA